MTRFRQIAQNAMQHSTIAAPGFVKSISARKNHAANRRRRKKTPGSIRSSLGSSFMPSF